MTIHPISFVNRVLHRIGYQLSVQRVKPKYKPEVDARFRRELAQVKKLSKDFVIVEDMRDDSERHPIHYIDFECEFASQQIVKYKPESILDVGSYRHWLIGVMASNRVMTIDVRARDSYLSNETVMTEDVGNMRLPSGSVDMVTTLNTIEHFGLGRYGDRFDLGCDERAVREMVRTIRPGGHFVLSVPVTGGNPCMVFNSHRIYDLEMVRGWVRDMSCEEERFIKRKPARICAEHEIATATGEFDVYCGCYRKRAP